ncbi:MAG TPA: hypothetical protein VF054_07065 [Micromonosporaceae bacterium]
MTTPILDQPPRTPRRPSRTRRLVGTLLVLVPVLVVAAVAVVLTRRGGERAAPQPSPPPAASAPSAPMTPEATTAAPSATAGAGATFRYLPLWPFASVDAATAWQNEANPGGHQPWRRDVAMTALTFTQAYLGFPEVDRVLGAAPNGDEAWVGVGYRSETGIDVVAATLHLAQIGNGVGDRPWEVVGSDNRNGLTLTTPGYGTTVASPVTMAGRVTGVDESLRAQVRGRTALLGEVVGVPAGGDNALWSATVTYRSGTDRTLLLVVSTSRHTGPGVARFAITGVRV